MDVRLIEDPDAFGDLAAEFMAGEPFSTNVIGVQLLGAREAGSGSRSQPGDDRWIAVLDGERVAGLGMHTPPYPPFLSRLPRGGGGAIATALLAHGRSVPGVNGESQAVAEFASAWTAKTGTVSVTDTAMRMYRLDFLATPPAPPGSSRPAGPADRELLLRWFEDFQREAHPQAPVGRVAEVVGRRIARGELWLWTEAESAVSVAGASTSAAGVSRIGPVYTPPNLRRRGFGAAVTAAATRAALGAGATQVVLYTDLANPVSNTIYQRLGYVPDHDAEERRFVEPDAVAPDTPQLGEPSSAAS